MPTKHKLPTLVAFKRLSFARKARVFRDWAASMRGSYNARSNQRCALGQFGTALARHEMEGICDAFCESNSTGGVMVLEHVSSHGMDSPIFPGCQELVGGPQYSTFAALKRRLDTYITKHYGRK